MTTNNKPLTDGQRDLLLRAATYLSKDGAIEDGKTMLSAARLLRKIARDGHSAAPVNDNAACGAQNGECEGQDAEPMYYLQDTRSYVGNCPMWWKEGGSGYTSSLDEAQRWIEARAYAQHDCRETDVPWLCSEIDKLRRPTVDMQYMRPVKKQIAAIKLARRRITGE